VDVAIGLPNAVPGTTGEQLVEWARRAEARGFSSLGTIDRIAYADHYAWLGEDIVHFIIAGAAKDAGSVQQQVAAYEEAGCDELIFFPSSGDPAQVDLLADAAGL
jgi:hypothetical protein